MMKNHKLAKSISDVAWREFRRQLEYKSSWYGKKITIIDRFAPSSKLCPNCNKKNDNLKLKDRSWTCPHCQAHHGDRDLLAAKNIKSFGLKTKNSPSQ